jgi:DNA-binding response OmpR family regulator
MPTPAGVLSSAKPKILVIEDDPDICDLLEYNLTNEGLDVVCAEDGERGLRLAAEARPSLILLDLMLPGIPGLEVCRRLRARHADDAPPIIIVTAKGEEADVVAGLELGADDYVVKPFRVRELIARVNAALRRGTPPPATPKDRVVHGPLVVDIAGYEATFDGEPLSLTLAEFRLLAALATNPGRVLTRARLMQQITAGGYQVAERNVDVHIAAIRRKLGAHGDVIATVRGVGYKFNP